MIVCHWKRAFEGLCLAALFFAPSAALAATPRPGVIRLQVDATHAPQRILHAHLTIPVESGPLTLLFPQWIPGEHMPDGPINGMAGLKFAAGKKTIPWRRDLLDMFAFHLEIPAGVTSLEATFDFLISGAGSGYSSGASSTAYLNDLNWNQLLLYPRGYAAKDLTYAASLKLPEGWKFATALPRCETKWRHDHVFACSAQHARGFARAVGALFSRDTAHTWPDSFARNRPGCG